jgi:hypothetical protein
MHWRAWIGERGDSCSLLEMQDVFDMMVDARRPAVCEDVGSDLTQRGFEEHELTIVDLPAGGLAQKFDGLVEAIQSFVKPAEVGTELKWLLGTLTLRSQ